ncbi:MAG: hypothetical protein U0703_08600 [Anaerolineae bacterium]
MRPPFEAADDQFFGLPTRPGAGAIVGRMMDDLNHYLNIWRLTDPSR